MRPQGDSENKRKPLSVKELLWKVKNGLKGRVHDKKHCNHGDSVIEVQNADLADVTHSELPKSMRKFPKFTPEEAVKLSKYLSSKQRKLFKGFLQNILKVYISKNERDRQSMRKMNLQELQRYTIIRA